MSKYLDPQATVEAARALQSERMDSVKALVDARNRVSEVRAQLDEAERDDARAYLAAESKGWTADELRKIGLAEPAKVGAPRRRRAAKPAATPPTH